MMAQYAPVAANVEAIGRNVVDAAVKVHVALGPGLLESSYLACLAHELDKRGLRVETQVPLALVYNEIRMPIGYRVDLLIEGLVVVEIKAVSHVLPVHEAQLLTYMRLPEYRLGFLLNFHVEPMKQGVKRMVL